MRLKRLNEGLQLGLRRGTVLSEGLATKLLQVLLKFHASYVRESPQGLPSKIRDVSNHAAIFKPLLNLSERIRMQETVSLIIHPSSRRTQCARQTRSQIPPINSAPSQARVAEVIVSQGPTTDVWRKRGVIHGGEDVLLMTNDVDDGSNGSIKIFY